MTAPWREAPYQIFGQVDCRGTVATVGQVNAERQMPVLLHVKNGRRKAHTLYLGKAEAHAIGSLLVAAAEAAKQ